MGQTDTGKLIAACRKERGLTQAQLAEKLNITDRAVSKWETGKSMPDASIMLELCRILNISVNELLSGEKIVVENADRKTGKATKKKNGKKVAAAILTAIMLVGVIVCGICDIVVTGTFTWSLIVLSAILFVWIVSIPVLLFDKRGVFTGMLSFSIFVIPFLFVLSILTKSAPVFRIGAVMSVLTLVYLWGIYALYIRFRNRKMLAAGIAFLLAIPFMLLMNVTLSKMIKEPSLDGWDMLSGLVLLVVGISFVMRDCARNRGE